MIIDPRAICGIDFGAKTAGTTAICGLSDKIEVVQSAKGKDADEFILDTIHTLKAQIIFIDAPLSLPSVYQKTGGGNYFYRKCDVDLKGMSPMFIGGLTARAMRLKAILESQGRKVFETYPAAFVRHVMASNHSYKTDLTSFEQVFNAMANDLYAPCTIKFANWHQADAAIAWLAGLRFISSQSLCFGDSDEGVIVL